MTADNVSTDPYQVPTPYDVLDLKKGIHSTSKDISKAYNNAQRKAKHIKNSEERAERVQQLDWAKEQVQRPENRVLVDFFLLSDDLFADLCLRCGQRLADAPLPTAEAIGPLFSPRKYDDLVPHPLSAFLGEFRLPTNLEWFDEDHPNEGRLVLCAVDF